MFKKLVAVIGALLCGVAVSHTAETRVILKPGPEGIDKWFGSYYNKQGVDDDILRVGGWYDYYDTLIKFDGATQNLPGAFKRAELWFYTKNTTSPTDMRTWLLTTKWSEAPWDHSNLMGYYLGAYPKPALGSGWYGLEVTLSVNYWRAYPQLNYGWCFVPAANNNQFDEFYSSDSTSASLRPELHLVYDVPSLPSLPEFKMPLENGKEWKLTTEAGGKSNDGTYGGTIDTGHTGKLFYSLDFGRFERPTGGGATVQESDISVLAMAGGYVYAVGNNPNVDPNSPNGYYVKIDHDEDGNPATGFQTVYCHLKSPPIVQQYQKVVQGQKLGIMGTTGMKNGVPTSTGIHLHVTFYYHDYAIGEGADLQLDQIRLERLPIKDYKLFTPNVSTPVFYSSSNVPR